MAENIVYSSHNPYEVCIYWKYRHMTRHPASPDIGKYEFGVFQRGQRYFLNALSKRSDLVTYIKINLGQQYYLTSNCIFCGRSDAPSFKGEPWSYHLLCAQNSASMAIKLKVPPISKCMEKELKFPNDTAKELMYEFIQMRQMVSYFDTATCDKYRKRREQVGIVDFYKWHYEDSALHVSFKEQEPKSCDKKPNP